MTRELDPLRQRPRTEAEPSGSSSTVLWMRRSMGYYVTAPCVHCNLQNMYLTGAQMA